MPNAQMFSEYTNRLTNPYTEEIEKLRSEILENPAKQDELIEELLLKTLSMTEHIEKQLDKKFEDPINV